MGPLRKKLLAGGLLGTLLAVSLIATGTSAANEAAPAPEVLPGKDPARERPAKTSGSGKTKGKATGGLGSTPASPKPAPLPAEPPAPEPTIEASPNPGLSDLSTRVSACDGTPGPPKRLIPIYIEASKRYGLGKRGPQILAAINRIETDFGRLNEVTSYAGAIGWMQFMPPTWDAYGVDGDGDGEADPYNARDAIHSAANYLRASGAPDGWYDAIFAYNHADWYVEDVLSTANCYGPLSAGPRKVDRKMDVLTCKADPKRSITVPNYYLRAFESAASRYELGPKGVWVMAAVAKLESDFGRGMDPAQMNETGAMGLSPEQWEEFAVDGDEDGKVNRDEPWDAVATFARMLWSEGQIKKGLFSHNQAAWYVEAVMREAKLLAGDCERQPGQWKVAYPLLDEAITGNPGINWDNLQILNASAATDIERGMIDKRVIRLLEMITQRWSIIVSSLRSDHSMLTTSGNISNHYHGRALDIAAADGVSCTDMSLSSPCSQIGRFLVDLPDGVKPDELIYGYDLDGPGPAFAMADHRDHIHAGFGP